jgi:glyoxylase-like metal-dependent hydrolase (beta-lactamase superfamily II)
MKYTVIPSGPLEVNCVIIHDDKRGVIFDPGGSFKKISEFLDKNSIVPEMIINTHGHFDHIGAVADLKNRYNIPFGMSRKDQFLLKQASIHASLFGLPPVISPEIDFDLFEGFKIENSITDIIIYDTPGHTPGGLSFYIKDLKIIITGDTLFCGSVGRTDFPYSDFSELKRSVKKLYNLDDDTIVIPGHGEFTTIGKEKFTNPFVR